MSVKANKYNYPYLYIPVSETMNPEVKINITSSLLEKIWKTFEDNCVSGLTLPSRIRREGKALADVQVERELRLAQLEKDIEAIKNGDASYENVGSAYQLTYHAKKGLPLLPSGEVQPLQVIPFVKSSESSGSAKSEYVARDLLAAAAVDAMRKEINLTKVIIAAEDYASSQEKASAQIDDAPIDKDWLYRWRDCASEVSNEEVQQLWARVLTGEAQKSGSFSLRSLEFLRNTSQKEAEEIAKLAPYVVENSIWRSDFLTKKGFKYSYFLSMQELGVVSGVEAVGGLVRKISPQIEKDGKKVFAMLGKTLALLSRREDLVQKNELSQKDEVEDVLEFSAYNLTGVGREIINLCSGESDRDYFFQLGKSLSNSGFKVMLAQITEEHEGLVTCDNEEEIK